MRKCIILMPNSSTECSQMMKNALILEKDASILDQTRGKGALFLDRDGVIIQDKHYLSDENEVELIKGAKEIIQETKERGHAVIIVTNQSGIARGKFTWKDYEKVTSKLIMLLGNEARPSAIYANGYSDDSSDWRKPNAGMIYQARKDLDIALSESKIVGDRHVDIKAGAKAGLQEAIQVLTGHGTRERRLISEKIIQGRYMHTSTKVRLAKDLNETRKDINWGARIG